MLDSYKVRIMVLLGMKYRSREIAENELRGRRVRFYSQLMKKGDLCFDVGANIGRRTDAFLALGARVVAVEPQKSLEQCLT